MPFRKKKVLTVHESIDGMFFKKKVLEFISTYNNPEIKSK